MTPFLQGRKTSEVAPLRPVSSSVAATTSCASVGGAAHAVPQVDVVKQGDKVVRIVVTCSCGERVEVECLYSIPT